MGWVDMVCDELFMGMRVWLCTVWACGCVWAKFGIGVELSGCGEIGVELLNGGVSGCIGFRNDSSIDDYKVVIGFRNKHSKSYVFEVLTLKSNVWRSVYVESGYDDVFGNGILCNGAIHWASNRNNKKVIVSFHLSKEVFKEIPQPKLRRSDWKLRTMKDCLCIFASPNINCKKNEDIEIWVMRKYNVQESWERKLPPPGYDTHKMMMHYFPQMDFFNRHVHIWLSEGSCAPVLVRSIEHSEDELHHRNAHIRLSTNSECNYNYDHHVFVKSLVSPHGSVGRESFVSHNSDGVRAKSKRQSHISSDSDDDGRRVERKRRETERESLEKRRRMERKRRERESESESLVFHSSDERRAKRKKQSLVSSYSYSDGRRAERRRRERERSQSEREMTMTMRGDTGEKGRN
ncbi:putative F-box domain-containing protein [Tanacetum coccineum]